MLLVVPGGEVSRWQNLIRQRKSSEARLTEQKERGLETKNMPNAGQIA